MRLLLVALFSLQSIAADISQYTEDGPVETLSGYTDLSDGVWIDGVGAAYVDNRAGRLDLPNGMASCYPGGDVEGVEVYQPGKLYTLNEAKNGVRVVDYATCNFERKFVINVNASGSDGLEGIAVKDGTVYVLEELTATIYYFVDSGGTSPVTPQVLFTIPDCNGAGGLTFNGNNIVAVCEPPSPTVVEYTLAGAFISEKEIPSLTNAEGVYFNGVGDLCVVSEPNLRVCSSLDGVINPPPETETCTYNGGSVEVTVSTGAFDPQTVPFTCPTANASGTLQ
jgi:hypothetical protein